MFQKHKGSEDAAAPGRKPARAAAEDFVFQKHKPHSAAAAVPARSRASFKRALIE